MADITVSQGMPIVNENKIIGVHFTEGHGLVVSSLDVAEHFQKRHTEILRSVRAIIQECPAEFTERNFAFSEYLDPTGRKLPACNLTRDGFTLLAMGFTGAAAMRWKIKYIEAFNALEKAALDTAQAAARQAALAQGARLALALPPEELAEVRRVVRYRERGFTKEETALVMGRGTSVSRVEKHLKTARGLGILPPVTHSWRKAREA